jgi:hypothetical protein
VRSRHMCSLGLLLGISLGLNGCASAPVSPVECPRYKFSAQVFKEIPEPNWEELAARLPQAKQPKPSKSDGN